jgi:H+/Cl- antiporter ClcA
LLTTTFVANCDQEAGISQLVCSNNGFPLSSLIVAFRISQVTVSNGSATSAGQKAASIFIPAAFGPLRITAAETVPTLAPEPAKTSDEAMPDSLATDPLAPDALATDGLVPAPATAAAVLGLVRFRDCGRSVFTVAIMKLLPGEN